MAKPPKRRFTFASGSDLTLDLKSEDVCALQTLLTSYGYLRDFEHQGLFCKSTRRALRRFQRFYGLKADGIAGPVTKGLLERPRCGVTDLPRWVGESGAAAPFVLRGCQYNRPDLSYAFLNGTGDLMDEREHEIVRQAFDAWQNVTNLSFTEVQPSEGPDFRIAWRAGDHGDGSPFDGQGGPRGNTLAHAFFPPPCGGANAGDLHFDEAETWTDDPAARGILLLQVAIHEIGHLLGLSHSQDEEAIMFAFYDPNRVDLAQDDIDGIQTLYGSPTDSNTLMLATEAVGTLEQTGDEDLFELSVSNTLIVKIDGPEDADFDLYVRRDQPPTVSEWDFRAFSVSADESITLPAQAGAKYFVLVRSHEGSGSYVLRVAPT